MKKKIIFEHKTKPYHIGKSSTLSPIPHFHHNIEVVYVISGSCVAYADRYSSTIKSGDFFISFPNQIHYYESAVLGEYYILIFNADILFGLNDTMYDNIPKGNAVTLSENDTVKKLLLSTLENYGEYEKTVIAGLINQAIAKVLPKFNLKPRIKTDNSSLQEVLKFCEKNFSTELSLESIANNLHMSKYHISHLLNEKLNISFNSYINMLRVNKACDLLEDTDKKIADISEEVGFGSIRSLNRSFLEILGTTPLKYRNARKRVQ